MSQPLVVIATLIAKPGQASALQQHLETLVKATRQEPGCITYELHQDLETPEGFYMFERWVDADALQIHDGSAHIQAFRAAAGELLGHFELKRLSLVA